MLSMHTEYNNINAADVPLKKDCRQGIRGQIKKKYCKKNPTNHNKKHSTIRCEIIT